MALYKCFITIIIIFFKVALGTSFPKALEITKVIIIIIITIVTLVLKKIKNKYHVQKMKSQRYRDKSRLEHEMEL